MSDLHTEGWNLPLCPICKKSVTVRKVPSGAFGISCRRKCFPDGFFTARDALLAASSWTNVWQSLLLRCARLSAGTLRCPVCGKTPLLLPSPDARTLLPVCRNGCLLPRQWACPVKTPLDQAQALVHRWSREAVPFLIWLSQPIDLRLWKPATPHSCPHCKKLVATKLVKSHDVIGEIWQVCTQCGAALEPGHVDRDGKKRVRQSCPKTSSSVPSLVQKEPRLALSKNKSGPATPASSNTRFCAICGRSQGAIEALGSCLERHHCIPLSDAGPHEKDNLIWLCQECHRTWHQCHIKIKAALTKESQGISNTLRVRLARFLLTIAQKLVPNGFSVFWE